MTFTIISAEIMILIKDTPINSQEIIDAANTIEAGALNVFIGTVRNQSFGKEVKGLYYEAFELMAIKEMTNIANEAKSKFKILKIAISHRVGSLQLGETAVVIAVSSAHRSESFKACQYIIDELKTRVPIWKKEIFSDGESWVSAHA